MSESLVIGGIIFPDMDQADFTGPFEVLSRLPNGRFLTLAKTLDPIRDANGLILTPEVSFADSPLLDMLLVPGGAGVNAVMEDTETLDFVRQQATQASLVLSVCTGALILGAAGLLKGRRITTHWATHHLLTFFGAIPQNERVVRDESFISTAGVTAGVDGALVAASILAGDEVAQAIQLYMEYDPHPPFDSGTPEKAPASVLANVRAQMATVIQSREDLVHRLTRSA